MRKVLVISLVCIELGAPAQAAVLIPVVPVANSTVTTVFGIDDTFNIAGSFIGNPDGIEHGFVGTLAGDYKTFDVGVGGTEPRGLNNNGFITGYSNSQSCCSGGWPIFERLPSGEIISVTTGGSQLYGFAQGIANKTNVFAGGYWDLNDFAIAGYIGRNSKLKADVFVPAESQATAATGINSANDIVGYYFTPPFHGFILHGKNFTSVDYPGAGETMLEGINDNGQAVGQWVDANNGTHSFVYDIASKKMTDIIVKGATQTMAWNINAPGAVAVSSDVGSFVWCPTRRACPRGGTDIDAPVH